MRPPEETVEPFYGNEYIPDPDEEPAPTQGIFDESIFNDPDPDFEAHELIEVGSLSTAPPSREDPFAGSKSAAPVPERVVRCVECDEKLTVSKHATSTICKNCSTYVNLENFDIWNHCREDIKTRGYITVHRKASLVANQIASENLRVYGKIAGTINCSGNAFFRTAGKVVGSLRCRHLQIHRSCALEFVPGIRAETAEIEGHIEGDIISEGTIRISKTGAVIGNCTAPAIQLEDGGILSGQMRIMKPDQAMDDDYSVKAQEAQESYFEHEMEEDLKAFEAAAALEEDDLPEDGEPMDGDPEPGDEGPAAAEADEADGTLEDDGSGSDEEAARER